MPCVHETEGMPSSMLVVLGLSDLFACTMSLLLAESAAEYTRLFRLNDSQEAAIAAAMANRVTIVQGRRCRRFCRSTHIADCLPVLFARATRPPRNWEDNHDW